MFNFKNYYKFPLKPMSGLETIKVLTRNNKPAFDWCSSFSIEQINCFIKDINGFKVRRLKPMESVYKDGIVYLRYSDIPLLRIRGWGYLTGIGGLHLSEDKAKEIRDAFGNYIVKQLNSH